MGAEQIYKKILLLRQFSEFHFYAPQEKKKNQYDENRIWLFVERRDISRDNWDLGQEKDTNIEIGEK